MEIKKIVKEDLPKVVAVHKDSFKGFFAESNLRTTIVYFHGLK